MDAASRRSDESSTAAELKERSKLLTVCPYILGNEFGERLAYYGLATNLVNYFKDIGAASDDASAVVNTFSGFCYAFPLLGGWLADSRWGRYRTILVFSVVYLIGMATLAGSAAIPGIRVEDGEDANAAQWALLGFCLILAALGAGGIKPNVSSFGADQFDDTKEKDRKEKKSFFNWFYLFINVGAFLASTVIVKIQDEDMWDIGFAIPGVALFFAVVMFVLGRPLYRFESPAGSPLGRFFRVTQTALRNRRRGRRTQNLDRAEGDDPSDAPLIANAREKGHWLNWAIGPGDFSEQQVYEVKLVYGVFPIFYTSILYWVIYQQMFTMFILQGDQMDRTFSFFGSEHKIPSASMSLFNTGSIILLVPLYDLLIVPALKRYFNYAPSLLQRSGLGYLFALLAMIAAYAIEKRRLALYEDGKWDPKEDDDEIIEVVRLSIWWQTIPYSLIGASEVMASIGLMEFFYDQAPDTMRSMMAALNLIAVSIGSYVSALLVKVANSVSSAAGEKWIPDNLNEGHLDAFFLLVAGMMLFGTVCFVILASRYKMKDIPHAVEGDHVDPQRLAENMGRSLAYHGEDIDAVERL